MNETGASVEGLQLALTFLLTARGTPMIYAGDEIGLPGGSDPDNRRDFPGGWPDDARSAFTEAGRTPAENALVARVRLLNRLRADLPALRRGSHVSLAVAEQAYAYARVGGGEPVVVVLNNATTPLEMDAPARPAGLAEGAGLEDRLEASAAVKVEGGRLRMRVPARSAAVYAARAPS